MVLMATGELEGYQFIQQCSYRIRLICGTKTMDVWISTDAWYCPSERPLHEFLGLRHSLDGQINDRISAEMPSPDNSINLGYPDISSVSFNNERYWIVLKLAASNATRNGEGMGESKELTLSGGLPWTQEEDRMLVGLRNGGGSFAEIASTLGRDEFQVLCRYTDIVPLPKSGPQRRHFVATIFWLRCDDDSGVGSGQWRIYGTQAIHCEV
jgi:hypothetical protein